MAQLQIAYLLRPGTQERWRRLCQELAASRLDQLEASCRQAEITQVQVRLVQLLHGELMVYFPISCEASSLFSRLRYATGIFAVASICCSRIFNAVSLSRRRQASRILRCSCCDCAL